MSWKNKAERRAITCSVSVCRSESGMKRSASFLILIALAWLSSEAAADNQSMWQDWGPLLGTWVAEGKGAPGSGAGTFSFAYDLQKQVIVRKSHMDYPATAEHKAFAHDDLMIIYREQGAEKTRADYFDNEGHVIRYTADISGDKKTLTLRSDPQPSQPVFRLTYNIGDNGRLTIKFEIASPTAPQEFKVYVEGSAHKTSG